jgi:hypothetical protein
VDIQINLLRAIALWISWRRRAAAADHARRALR